LAVPTLCDAQSAFDGHQPTLDKQAAVLAKLATAAVG